MAGYHLREIPKGVLGKFSKVEEEFEEFIESFFEQKCLIMAFVELSDLIGALEHYYKNQHLFYFTTYLDSFILEYSYLKECSRELFISEFTKLKNNPNSIKDLSQFLTLLNNFMYQYNMSLDDLRSMSKVTQRAFSSGERI